MQLHNEQPAMNLVSPGTLLLDSADAHPTQAEAFRVS